MYNSGPSLLRRHLCCFCFSLLGFGLPVARQGANLDTGDPNPCFQSLIVIWWEFCLWDACGGSYNRPLFAASVDILDFITLHSQWTPSYSLLISKAQLCKNLDLSTEFNLIKKIGHHYNKEILQKLTFQRSALHQSNSIIFVLLPNWCSAQDSFFRNYYPPLFIYLRFWILIKIILIVNLLLFWLFD